MQAAAAQAAQEAAAEDAAAEDAAARLQLLLPLQLLHPKQPQQSELLLLAVLIHPT